MISSNSHPYGDRKYSNTLPQKRGGGDYKTNGNIIQFTQSNKVKCNFKVVMSCLHCSSLMYMNGFSGIYLEVPTYYTFHGKKLQIKKVKRLIIMHNIFMVLHYRFHLRKV